MTDPTATAGDASRSLPPYTAFSSFKTSLQVLRDNVVPNRIDRSIWAKKFSGSVTTQILTAYRFLGLVSAEGAPEQKLEVLVNALDTPSWTAELRDIIKDAYAPIFTLDLEKVTVSEFFQKFYSSYGAEGDTARKCVTFFLQAASEASIPVSAYLKSGAKPRTSSGKKRPKRAAAPQGQKENDVEQDRNPPGGAGAQQDLTAKLLDKFPEFDPQWPDDLKKAWFAGFSEFMGRAGAAKGDS